MAKKVLIGLLGPTLDTGYNASRWERWRPSISTCQHEDFLIDRFELLHQSKFSSLANIISDDIKQVSPETEVTTQLIELNDPWDFEEVYGCLHNFSRNYNFKDDEEYYIHITTGTHVAQICLFLLTESRHLPGRILQSSPPRGRVKDTTGSYSIIDLDLSRYDKLANRFKEELQESHNILKSGISTKDKRFNKLIERIETISIRSNAPILLTGPTGAGKSQLAKQIYGLRSQRHQIKGKFIEVNCATLRGDTAMSTLFGHKKGAFTGAQADRAGLLCEADKGILFLDEIGELGLDEQAMLLRALEEKTFLPMGSDQTARSDFELICGTNRDLTQLTAEGMFRDDLLARINIWTFELPGLKDRKDDIEPNIDYELTKFSSVSGNIMRFTAEGKDRFLKFSKSPEATWKGNFRDLNAAILRMSTLADAGRITEELVSEEIQRLRHSWATGENRESSNILREILTDDQLKQIDPFDKPQLENTLKICQQTNSLSEAGRVLFSVSRELKKTPNDADRLRKYLAKFGITWQMIKY